MKAGKLQRENSLLRFLVCHVILILCAGIVILHSPPLFKDVISF